MLGFVHVLHERPVSFLLNFEKVAKRVSSLFDLEKDYITGRGRQRNRVRARDLLCYWCAIELRNSNGGFVKKT